MTTPGASAPLSPCRFPAVPRAQKPQPLPQAAVSCSMPWQTSCWWCWHPRHTRCWLLLSDHAACKACYNTSHKVHPRMLVEAGQHCATDHCATAAHVRMRCSRTCRNATAPKRAKGFDLRRTPLNETKPCEGHSSHVQVPAVAARCVRPLTPPGNVCKTV
jgi:hypothetical protein